MSVVHTLMNCPNLNRSFPYVGRYLIMYAMIVKQKMLMYTFRKMHLVIILKNSTSKPIAMKSKLQ